MSHDTTNLIGTCILKFMHYTTKSIAVSSFPSVLRDCNTVFYPGYLELWLASNSYLVLFIQYILNTVSIAYICII